MQLDQWQRVRCCGEFTVRFIVDGARASFECQVCFTSRIGAILASRFDQLLVVALIALRLQGSLGLRPQR
nr:hypothetical protein [Liquorilactobacillus satsumensis]